MLTYRVNRLPDKLHVALLDLLGVELHGPTAARTHVRFRLAAPPETADRDPGRRHRGRDPAHRRRGVDRLPGGRGLHDCTGEADRLRRRARRPGEADRRGRRHRPAARPRIACRSEARRKVDDALYLGFEEDIANLVIQVEIDGSTARGAGVDPEDPPLRWEVSQSGGGMGRGSGARRSAPAGSTTAPGSVELQCPADVGDRAAGRQADALAALPGRRAHTSRA